MEGKRHTRGRDLETGWSQRGGIFFGRGRGKGSCADLCIISLNTSQVPQVTLVAHQHDDNVGISMVTQLLEPPLHILKGHCTRHDMGLVVIVGIQSHNNV